ncbi:MAG: hypothetical protein GY862_17230 [Gammaproteobacteria bacterium]|nr:hypothetical protein [Gammaproteobacteria bacterium]
MPCAVYPGYYALRHPQPAELRELQKNILRPGEMLLAYAVMKESVILWLIGKERFEMFTLPLNEEQLAHCPRHPC